MQNRLGDFARRLAGLLLHELEQQSEDRLEIWMIIRKETRSNSKAITQVTIAAFRTLAISNHTEQFIIKALRAADAITLSLVEEKDLERRFGDEYLAYKENVPRWIPRLRPWKGPETQRVTYKHDSINA